MYLYFVYRYTGCTTKKYQIKDVSRKLTKTFAFCRKQLLNNVIIPISYHNRVFFYVKRKDDDLFKINNLTVLEMFAVKENIFNSCLYLILC